MPSSPNKLLNTRSSPPHTFIAEIGTSHNGDFLYAKELIDAAKESGANAVKFQWIIAQEIVSPYTGLIALPKGNTDIYKSFSQLEKDKQFYADIKDYAESKNLEFLCSVFGFESLEFLLELNPTCIKIASPEINHIFLLQKIKELSPTHNFSIILSDGISTFLDIANAISILSNSSTTIDTTILRCVTQYPANPIEYQLSRLATYKNIFNCKIGVSDHTTHPYLIPSLASMLGSTTTEKHFTLDKKKHGLDDSFALNPNEFLIMVETVNEISTRTHHTHIIDIDIEQLFSDFPHFATDDILHSNNKALISRIIQGDKFSACNLPIYYTTRRSVFSKKDIPKGSLIDCSNSTLLRSETNLAHGIPAEYFFQFDGMTALHTIQAHHPITWNDISPNPHLPLFES